MYRSYRLTNLIIILVISEAGANTFWTSESHRDNITFQPGPIGSPQQLVKIPSDNHIVNK